LLRHAGIFRQVVHGSCYFIEAEVTNCNYDGCLLNSDAFIQAYYRLFNCGFCPGLAEGSDYPCCNDGELCSILTYVLLPDGQFTYRKWMDGIAKGRTVVSRIAHNEFLQLNEDGDSTPGDEVRLKGHGDIKVTLRYTAK
jgi:hypothetical protein